MSSRRHRGLVGLLLLVGTAAAILACGAVWLRRDVLDAPRWTATSERLIADPAVRRAVGGFVVQRGLGGVDSALRSSLPFGLGADAERALDRAAGGVADDVLRGGEGRRAWRDANRQAVTGLLASVDHPARGRGVSLELTPLLSDLLAGLAGAPTIRAIPGASNVLSLHGVDAGRLVLLSPAQVHDIAPGVRVVRALAWALPVAAALAFLLALALAGGWRTRALSRAGYGLAVAGGVVLAVRALAQFALADAFVSSSVDRAAVRAAWLIATVPLRTEGLFLVIAGAILAVGSWLMRAVL